MLYVFYGPDQFRAREELRKVRDALDRDGNLVHNTASLEGRDLTPADLQNACQSASFFAENRLVIVNGLQTRFSGWRRRARRSSSSGTEIDAFIEVLVNLPPSTTVVLLDEAASRSLLDAVQGQATVKEFRVLRNQDLKAWAQARVKSQGASFDARALDRLVSLIDGYHLGELANEIDKLATYAYGRTVRPEDVEELTGAAVQMQTWDLTDAVIEGRTERALAAMQRMDAKDQPPQLIMAVLRRQYRQLLLAQSLQAARVSQAEIGEKLGLRDFPLRKVTEQAGRYDAAHLEAGYRRILQADVDVKTGVLDVDTALEMLIVELSELARGPRRRAAGVI